MIGQHFSYQIDRQFPAIYRENGRELIDLVKAYYRFVESTEGQMVREMRRMPINRDVDTTANDLLIYFKNKYLADLPFDEDTIRFAVKNILDLYRRKGTEDGINLFFKMFYDSTVSIYYPSVDILRPSDSTWKVGRYLEMMPGATPGNDVTGADLSGSVSGARAVVDFVSYNTVGGRSYPVIFLSAVRGSFVPEDRLYANGVYIGRVYGSLDKIIITPNVGEYDRVIGESVIIRSKAGVGKATVSDISQTPNGSLPMDLVYGGFGYTMENSVVLITEQNLTFNSPQPLLKVGMTVTQGDAKGTVFTLTGNEVSIKHSVDSTAHFIAGTVEYNGTVGTVIFASTFNNLASADVGRIENTEEYGIIIDKLHPYLDVRLNASDFSAPPATASMSGNIVVNLDTVIDDAFEKLVMTFGAVAELTNINTGYSYIVPSRAKIIDDLLTEYKFHEQLMSLQDTGNVLINGTVVTQANGAKGTIAGYENGFFRIKPLSITRFTRSLPIMDGNRTMGIRSLITDRESDIIGQNAIISTSTSFGKGRVTELTVVNSGFGFISRGDVKFYAEDGLELGEGTAIIGGEGRSEGVWVNNSSQLNSAKRLQDSDYYQVYSYEIMTSVSPKLYDEIYKTEMHPVGTKKFHRFDMEERVNNVITIDAEIEVSSR